MDGSQSGEKKSLQDWLLALAIKSSQPWGQNYSGIWKPEVEIKLVVFTNTTNYNGGIRRVGEMGPFNNSILEQYFKWTPGREP